MILRCNFEELAALTAGARLCLAVAAGGVGSAVADGPLDDVEALLPRLAGDVAVETLADQESIERATDLIVAALRERMEQVLLEQYVGAEDAVASYFDFANALTVHDRVRRMGAEMAAMAELLTGEPADSHVARTMQFPD